jgi:hypothetical protein
MPGRKVLVKADKRVRVTDDTFAKWRKQREHLGFKYDEDFAQYLLRVGESLQRLNMLGPGDREPYPMAVDSELRYANYMSSTQLKKASPLFHILSSICVFFSGH